MKADVPKKAKGPEGPPDYRLVELRATGFKKLKAVAITMQDGAFKVWGQNEQGKSSLLDALMAAVGGPAYFPPEPIRSGSKESEILVDFTALKLVRRIWRKEGGGYGQEVRLQFADGKRPAKAQTVLDELRGSPIADDPLEFSRLKPRERLDLLKKLVPDVDFDELAQRRKALFDDRTQVGRDHDRAKGVVESIEVPANARLTEVDVGELASALREATQANADIDRRSTARADAADRIEALRDEVDALRAQAKDKEAEADQLQAKLNAAPALPEKIDTQKIERELASADETNRLVRRAIDRAAKVAERDRLSDEYEQLTKQIEALDQQKTDAVASIDLPVQGLELGETDIMLNGLPFEQASSARKIQVSTALLMALKPDLRFLLIREGSLLDDDMRAVLDAEAKRNRFVVLMECVGAGDGTGVVIEDGEVA